MTKQTISKLHQRTWWLFQHSGMRWTNTWTSLHYEVSEYDYDYGQTVYKSSRHGVRLALIRCVSDPVYYAVVFNPKLLNVPLFSSDSLKPVYIHFTVCILLLCLYFLVLILHIYSLIIFNVCFFYHALRCCSKFPHSGTNKQLSYLILKLFCVKCCWSFKWIQQSRTLRCIW